MIFKVRSTKDFNLVLELNSKIFPEDKLELDEKTVAWIVYNSQGQPVAFCTARKLLYGILYMDRAGVLPDYQGKGIHRKLINARERFAKKNGFKKIITYVMKHNYQSLCTLVRCDFKLYNPEYAYAGREVLYFIKVFKSK